MPTASSIIPPTFPTAVQPGHKDPITPATHFDPPGKENGRGCIISGRSSCSRLVTGHAFSSNSPRQILKHCP